MMLIFTLQYLNTKSLSVFFFVFFLHRMAPEVIACDENSEATYDNRVCICIVMTTHLNIINTFINWKML